MASPLRGLSDEERKRRIAMLYWSAVFFIVAIIAGVFGFLGIASAAAGIAKVLFFIFAVLFVVSLITGMRGRGTPRV
jgi:uncharacterized membrane protein YtjA (UPF0391 family)